MKIYLLTSHICGSICFHEFLTFNLYHIHTKCLPFFRRDAPTHDDTPPHQKRKEQIAELEILENVLFNHIYLYLSKYVYIYILFIDIYIYRCLPFVHKHVHPFDKPSFWYQQQKKYRKTAKSWLQREMK